MLSRHTGTASAAVARVRLFVAIVAVVGGLIVLAPVGVALAANGIFSGPTNYPVGTAPNSVGVGEFNGDGDPDLAVANSSTNNVSILLGATLGTFGAATDFPAGTGPQAVVVRDFNGDTKADLAVANFSGNDVSILLGTGAGTFGTATHFPVPSGSFPFALAVGEFNGDTNADLAVAGAGGNVSILLGTGPGTFGAATNFPAGNGPRSVVVGDFNADTKADLAVANNFGNDVSILLGTGSGSFGTATSVPAGNGAETIAVGEFNGDGDPDLAVANFFTNVSILLGAMDGTFTAAPIVPMSGAPWSVAIGEFNGDAHPDLAATDNAGNNVAIFLGATGGAFAAAPRVSAGTGPQGVAVGDFNADADPDLAVANRGGNNVSILLGHNALATLTVSTSGAGSGTVTGTGISCGPNNAGDCSESVSPGTVIALTANPAANSTFDAFSGAGCTTSPCSVTVDAAKSVDANFDLKPRTLTVTTSGAGSGTVTGTGISCGPNNTGDCSETVPDGTTIALTANPAGNSTFDTFSGVGCTTSPCNVTMDANKSIDANFDVAQRTLTVTTSGSGSGTVTGTGISCGPNNTGDCSETVDHGTSIVLTANPAANSTFNTFAGAGCTTSPCSVTMDATKAVDAKFDSKQHTLTVTTSGGGAGTVTGTGISCGPNNTGDCAQTVVDGTVIVLTATPAATSTFNTFAGSGCTTSPCSVTLNADESVDAKFDLKPRTLTVTTSGLGSGTVTGTGISCGPNNAGDCTETVNHGTVIVLTATASAGSRFVAFSGAGCTTSPCSATMDAAKSVNANFLGSPAVTITAPPSGAVVAIGSTTIATYSCSAPGSTITRCTAAVRPPTGTPVAVATGTKVPAAVAGTHTITVTATNAAGLTATPTRTYVVAAPPTVTIDTPATGTVLPLASKTPARYTCASVASTIVKCSASVTRHGDTTTVTVSPGGELPALAADTYTLTVVANDSVGQLTSVTRTYVVAARPGATITKPASGAIVDVGSKVAAGYTCASAASTTVKTCAATVKPPTGAAAPLSNGSNVPSVDKGKYTITLTATDAIGQTTTTASTYTVAVCLRKVAFGLVEVTTEGCMVNEGTEQAPRYETSDATRVNGISLPKPPAGTKFVAIAPTPGHAGGQIKHSSARIALGSFTAFDGKIDWDLPAGGKGQDRNVTALRVPSGQTVGDLRVKGTIPLAFGYEGSGNHFARFPLEITLPGAFTTGPNGTGGEVTASAEIRVDNSAIQYDRLRLVVGNAYIGSMPIESACFAFWPAGSSRLPYPCPEASLTIKPWGACGSSVGGERWDGNIVMTLPGARKRSMPLFGGFVAGRIDNLGGIVARPDATALLAEGVQYGYGTGVGLCLASRPYRFEGPVDLSIFPTRDGAPTIRMDQSYWNYTDADPGALSVGGGGRVIVNGEVIGSGAVGLRPTGMIDFNADLKLLYSSPFARIEGPVIGAIDTTNRTFSLSDPFGRVISCIVVHCGRGVTVMSNVGFSICLPLGQVLYFNRIVHPPLYKYGHERVEIIEKLVPYYAGLSRRWGSQVTDTFGESCDIGAHDKANPRAFRASPQDGGPLATGWGYAAGLNALTAGPLAFTVPAKAPAFTVRVQGNGGPPSVVLHGPSGETIADPGDGSGFAESPGKWILVENPKDATTSVALLNPRAGAWSVTQGPGPVAPSSIQTAGYSPPPAFKAAVRSRSRYGKTLDIEYRAPDGAALSVVEESKTGKVTGKIAAPLNGRPCRYSALGSDTGSEPRCAKVRFTPTDGPGGKRDVYAIVTRADGMPRAKTKIATYIAPAQARPSLPRGLRVRRTRSRRGMIVSWRLSRPAVSQTISVALSSGAKFGLKTKRCSSVYIADVPSKVAVNISVAGLRADLRTGRYARVQLAGGKTEAGAQGSLRRRTCRLDYKVGDR